MSVSDFLYYTVLKKGGIIILILGVLLGTMLYFYVENWGANFQTTTENARKKCDENADCFYWCDECVSIASTKTCEACLTCRCVCNNETGMCELA